MASIQRELERRVATSFAFFVADRILEQDVALTRSILAFVMLLVYIVSQYRISSTPLARFVQTLFSQISLFILTQLLARALIGFVGEVSVVVLYIFLVVLASFLENNSSYGRLEQIKQVIFAVALEFSSFFLALVNRLFQSDQRLVIERTAVALGVFAAFAVWVIISPRLSSPTATSIITQTLSFIVVRLLLLELPEIQTSSDALVYVAFFVLALIIVILVKEQQFLALYIGNITNSVALFFVELLREAFLESGISTTVAALIAGLIWVTLLAESRRVRTPRLRQIVSFITQAAAGLSTTLFLRMIHINSAAETSQQRQFEALLTIGVLVPLALAIVWRQSVV